MDGMKRELSAEERGQALIRLLDVQRLGEGLFEGAQDPLTRNRVFGGQVIAQGLSAASRTVKEARRAHSLHAYFLRPGDDRQPIRYEVITDFEGQSFCNRRVVARQGDRVILTMSASFQREADGFHHQDSMPDVPAPEELPTDQELAASLEGRMPEPFLQWLGRPRAIELRRVTTSLVLAEKSEPHHAMWFRASAAIGDDPLLNRAVLAYASDMALLGTAMMPHGVNWITPGMRVASIDHALWMHRAPRMSDWHLYVTDSPWADGGRGLSRGKIYSRDGALVADVAQEGLMRLKTKD